MGTDISIEAEYNEYAKACKYALRIVQARLENLQDQINDQEENYNPFEQLKTRIKTFSSTYRKCQRKGRPDPDIAFIKENIRDIIGIRIITPFFDDVYNIADAIESQPGINIVERKDYIATPKENGYQSLHLIGMSEVYTGKSQIIPYEIQLRTGAMNLWSKREHLLQYKNASRDPETRALFEEASNYLTKFDQKIMQIRKTSFSDEEEETRMKDILF